MALKDSLTSRIAVKIYIVLAVLFILVIVLDSFVLPSVVHSRKEIVIPDVAGMKTDRAQIVLSSAGLKPVVTGNSPSSDVPPGHIIFQDPVPKSVVREGRNVYLTVSGGVERIVMPNLRGRSLRDAKIALEQMDLKLGLVTYEASDLPAETVVSQSMPAGKKIKKSQVVEIVVSGGSDIQMEVPYVIGLSLEEAQQKLHGSGLRLGEVGYRESRSLLPNTVIGQNPSAGTPASANTPVNLVVVH